MQVFSRPAAAARLEYESAGAPAARPHVLIARDVLVILMKLIGFLVIVLGFWNALADVVETLLRWMSGTGGFPPSGPRWIRIVLDALLAELDTFLIGSVLLFTAEFVVRWLLPRR